jgi:hypothetical protein
MNRRMNMAEVKKSNGFKVFMRKILRFFVRLFKKIGLFFKKSYNSFMKLKPYIRYIIYVWTIIIVVLIIFIVLSKNNNDYMKKYKTYEDNFKNISLEYVKEKKVYPTKEKPIKLSLDMMKSYGYVTSNDIEDKSCVGYSMVYYDDEHEDYNIKTYINCDKYTTEGYK